MAKAGLFVNPERCYSGQRPSACGGGGVFGNLRVGCRVSFPRATGAKGVVIGSRTVVLFVNSNCTKYERIDSSPLALATSLRNIHAGDPSLPLMYSRPLADDGTVETAYTSSVDEVFGNLHKAKGPFDRSQNIWVLLYAPTTDEPPYIVMGRFRFESYLGGALCVVPQDELVASQEIFDRVSASARHRSIVAHAPHLKKANDLESQAKRMEDKMATLLAPSAKRARTEA